MDRSLFRFILRYSKWEQLRIAPIVLGTMLVYYLSLDLPKTIINKAIRRLRVMAEIYNIKSGRVEVGFWEVSNARSLLCFGCLRAARG